MEFIVQGQVVAFRVEIQRELHCFRSETGEIGEIVFFKYDRDGAWYCFSRGDKALLEQIRAWCIRNRADAPGYNDLVASRREQQFKGGS